MSAPWTEIGRIQSDISSIESRLHGKVDSYEISSLRSDLAYVKNSVEQLRTEIDGIRFELQRLQENILTP